MTPDINSARHVLSIVESLAAEILHDLKASSSVVAVDDDPRGPMWLKLVQSVGRLVHRNQLCASNATKFKFVGLSTINQQKIIARTRGLLIKKFLDGCDVDLNGKVGGGLVFGRLSHWFFGLLKKVPFKTEIIALLMERRVIYGF